MKSLITPNRSWWASIRMKIDVHGLILTKIHSPRATCQHSNLTLTCLGAGEAMAGFPCWEPLEKQFSVSDLQIDYFTLSSKTNKVKNRHHF